jgi:transposase
MAALRQAQEAESHKLYRCHDRLLEHKQAVFEHLTGRWRDLFNVSFDVLLYDLTSTYFESDPPFADGDKRRHGYSRDHRSDCVQVIIALVVTPEGLPLAYEVLPGNTADNTTLRGFLDRIERQYGKARRIWLMERGVPTEAVLAEMRAADPPVQYLVGTPKGPGWRRLWSPSPGRTPGRACKSSCCHRMASSTSSPRAPTGLPRSGRSAAAR